MARGEHEMPADLGWLTDPERAWLDRFRYTKRRTEYLLRRWTAKHAVAAALGRPRDAAALASIMIGNHPTGAPYALVDGAPLDGDISISDRAGWAVGLVGRGLAAVGIDLEIVEPRTDGFVSDFLTADEQARVRALANREAQDAAANLYWSAKEAALKVLRTGLRADTRTVEVLPSQAIRPDGWASLEVRHTPSGRVFPGWWRIDGVFVLTIAADDRSALAQAPPQVLADSADLTGAEPTHSWLANPVAW